MIIVLAKAFSFLFVIFMAYFFKRIGLFKKEHYSLFAKVTMNFTLPAAIIKSLSDYSMSADLLMIALIALVFNLICTFSSAFLARKKDSKTRALEIMCCSGYNMGNFALPFSQQFFGAEGFAFACIFDAGNSLMSNGGTYAIAGTLTGSGKKFEFKAFLKKLVTAPIITHVVMFCVSLAHLRLPEPLQIIINVPASANGFMSMFTIGLMFEIRLEKSYLKEMANVLLKRYILGAIFAAATYFLLPFPLLVRKVIAVVVFSPIPNMSNIYLGQLDGDVGLSSFISSVSIILSTFIMTAMITLLGL